MAGSERYEVLAVCARFIMDLSAIVLAYVLTMLLVWLPGETFWFNAQRFLPYLGIFTAVWIGAAIDQKLFVSWRTEALVRLLFAITKAFFAAMVITAFLMALFMAGGIHRKGFIVLTVLSFVFILLLRLLMRIRLWGLRRRGYNRRQLIFVGANPRTLDLIAVILANEQYGYQIQGFLEDDPERRALLEPLGIPFLGEVRELEKLLTERAIDEVYVTLPVRSQYEAIQDISHLCEGVGVSVRFLADLFPLRLATSDAVRRGDIPLLSLTFEPERLTRFALRRAVDVATSFILVAALFPIFILFVIFIKMESPGPVFVSRRIALPGHTPFNRLRFRTTYGAEGVDRGSYTRVGNSLHRYGLDELPQLWNVLRGDMSLTHNSGSMPGFAAGNAQKGEA